MGDTIYRLLTHPQFKIILQYKVCFEGVIVSRASSFIIKYARCKTAFNHLLCHKIEIPPLSTFFIYRKGYMFSICLYPPAISSQLLFEIKELWCVVSYDALLFNIYVNMESRLLLALDTCSINQKRLRNIIIKWIQQWLLERNLRKQNSIERIHH